MTTTGTDTTARTPLDFQVPADHTPGTEHLFTGIARYVVQTPPVRNDYKKKSGSSDGAKTYDTTAT